MDFTKSSVATKDDPPVESRKTSTVDELLRMLTEKGSIGGNRPPPIPPKPRACLDSTRVAEKGFRRYFSSRTDVDPSGNVIQTESVQFDKKSEAYNSSMKIDNTDECDSPVALRGLSSNPSEVRYSQRKQQQLPHHNTSSSNESFLHRSSTKLPPTTDYVIENYSDRVAKPFVTESPEETNNNNNIVKRNRTTNTSTVEILEVPYKARGSTYGNPTFSRSQQKQLFYENNSYATPVITSAADYDDRSEDEVVLPTEIEVETMLNDSASENPQRTSTPNSAHFRPGVRSIIQISTSGNNPHHNANSTMQQEYLDDDLLDVSRESDETTNTSALNQSGGGELVGLYDNVDTANNSKESARANTTQDRVSYTVQMPEQTLTQSLTSPLRNVQKHDSSNPHPACMKRMDELETLIKSLTEQVQKLDNQVLGLTSKFEQVERRLGGSNDAFRQSNHREPSTIESEQQEKLITPNILKNRFSQSALTINKLGSNSIQQPTGSNPMSTYSRTHVATISRNSQPSPGQLSSSAVMSTSTSHNSANKSLLQPCSNTVTKPLKKKTIHASANSLYADSLKSGNTSISPTPNYQNHRQSTSPTSLMTLSTRRDPLWHTSMTSLSSLSQQGGSTLKKSTVAGSISNLSQVGSQLSNWPSFSDFVPAKHRAKDILYSEEERLIRMVLYNIPITMRLPNWIESNYNIDKIVEPPAVRLKLDWVHGYRGKDCRSNISYLPTGECVYFVASIIVLYNPDDKAQRHYLGHTDSVKCIAVHPNRLIIASGQSTTQDKPDKRPIVRVWNTVSLATLKVIGFNEDFDRPICCIAFSKQDQGATLAVVDESNEHTITLLDWQRDRNWRLAETNSGHEPVLAIDFHPIDKYTLVAVGKASINFWDTRGMTLTKKAGLFDKYDKPKYVLCLTFNDLGDTITGDSNGNLIIWSRGSNRPKKIIHDAHQGGVFSVLAMKDGSYLTGGRDRRIVEWDDNFNRTGREAELPEHCGGVRYMTFARGSQVLVGTLRNSILLGSLDKNFVHIVQGHSEATSALAIHPNQSQYLTGGFDDQIHLFDTIAHEVVWSKCIMMPATAASFSPDGLLLVIGSTLGKWLVLDAVTQEILFTKCDGSGTISVIKISPSGEFFCMGSSDSQVYVYQTTEAGNKFCRIGTCVGHTGPIKEIDWDIEGRYIQTQSMNFELFFWKAHNCRPLDDEDVIDDLKWFTHNCTIGFSVIGIWSDSIDSSLINHCDKSNSDRLMATVTDTGNLNIFKWPPCYNQCLSQKYYGNVEKFNFIKFLADDSRLIAIGTKNCVTTEWLVDKDNVPDIS